MLIDYAEIPEGSWVNAKLKNGTWHTRLVLPDRTEVVARTDDLFESVDEVHVKYTDMAKNGQFTCDDSSDAD